MIFYLSTERNKHPIKSYLEDWGANFISHIKLITYEQIIRLNKLPVGTYIFSDIELLTPEQGEKIAKIWEQLSSTKNNCLINHPTRSMKRYELLRNLYNCGWNQFNIYYINECTKPKSFPVFIRIVNDHNGAQTPLINTPQELNKIINDLSLAGKSKEDRIITEFCNTSDEQNIFRKYSALIIGERIIPMGVFLGHNWMLKSSEEVDSVEKIRCFEEAKYIESNPHKSELRKIFQLARINYGRIDYAVLDSKIQTWEINTNPSGLYTVETDKDNLVMGVPINEYLSKQIELAFEAIDYKNKYPNLLPISVKIKNPSLIFPLTIGQKFLLFFRFLLPYPYKIYPYKLLIKIYIKKIKFLITKIKS
jgi:hypothetical protein